jgi:4-hydroxy-tetrahydrodipicolinate synthase
MSVKSLFKGSGVALITPFNDKGVDFGQLEKLIEFQIKEGTDAIVACGTTGEPATMTDSEKQEVIKFTVKTVNKRIPVIAGTGGNNTEKSIRDSLNARDFGVDGLLLITPYYNKATQGGIIAHFTAIAD